MELKKSEKANLEKQRFFFTQIGFVVTLGLILLAFEWGSRPTINTDIVGQAQNTESEEMIPITRQMETTPPPPPPPAPKIREIEIEEVKNDHKVDDANIQSQETSTKDVVENIVIQQEEEAAKEEEVFFIVEDMPSFNGGDVNNFRTWVQTSLKYPEIAAENGISGRVFVQFAVNAKGDVVDAKVVRSADPALDKEAIRVIMSSPKWVPGKQRGKSVKVQYTLPIVFVLQ